MEVCCCIFFLWEKDLHSVWLFVFPFLKWWQIHIFFIFLKKPSHFKHKLINCCCSITLNYVNTAIMRRNPVLHDGVNAVQMILQCTDGSAAAQRPCSKLEHIQTRLWSQLVRRTSTTFTWSASQLGGRQYRKKPPGGIRAQKTSEGLKEIWYACKLSCKYLIWVANEAADAGVV